MNVKEVNKHSDFKIIQKSLNSRQRKIAYLKNFGPKKINSQCIHNANNIKSSKALLSFKELSVGQLICTKNNTFKVIEELALGRSCEVYIGEDASSSIKRAVKVFMKHQNYKGALARELKFLSVLGPHSHIVTHQDFVKSQGNDILIQELLSKTLKDIEIYLQDNEKFTSIYINKLLALHLMKALSHLQSFGVVHGDLKPQNIMWCAESELFKLIDFGISYSTSEKIKHQVQARAYQAPEALLWNSCLHSCKIDDSNEIVRPGLAADIWGAGSIIAELMVGARIYPFGWDGDNVPSAVDSAFERLNGSLPQDFLVAAKAWLVKAMDVDWKSRPSAQELLNDSFWPKEFIKPKLIDLLLLPTKVLRLIRFLNPEFMASKTEVMKELLDVVLRDYKCIPKIDEESGSVYLLFDSAQFSTPAFQTIRKTCIRGYTIVPSYFPYSDWCENSFY